MKNTCNRSRIMKNANVYAKVMPRSAALRLAWKNEKAQDFSEAAFVRPDDFRAGDSVAISVGALDGQIWWYTFDQINRDYDADMYVVGFSFNAGRNTINFVLSKTEQIVVNRQAMVAEKAA